MAYGNLNGGNSAEQSAQSQAELQASQQRAKTNAEQSNQTPRAYGGQPSSGVGSGPGSGARPSSLNPFANGSSSGVGSGSGLGVPLTPQLPPPTEVKVIKQERPEDPSEVAEKSPLILSNLSKQVFERSSFNNTLDIEFSQLGPENQLDPSFFDVSLATLEDFWTLYDQFFYDIPKTGPRSHETLAQTSGEYANFELVQEQIQALLDEIAEIREENVELRIENVNLTVSGSIAESELQSTQAQLTAAQST